MSKGVVVTDEQRETIREMLDDAKPIDQIARKMHLSKTTINRVRNGKATGRQKRRPARTYTVTLDLTLGEISTLLKMWPDVLS